MSPIAQKLSLVAMRMIRSSGRPAILRHRSNGLVVVVVDGDGELFRRQPEVRVSRSQRILDRIVLEIVAERKVAQHLEERVVARRIADIVEIVVLAARAHAFLRGRRPVVGPLLDAGEDVLELHHPGVGEHERRVVARHERARRHDVVPILGEELEKVRSNVVDAAHAPKSLEIEGRLAGF